MDKIQPFLDLLLPALSWVLEKLLSLAVITTGITLVFNGLANRKQAADQLLQKRKEAVSKVVAKAKEIIPILSLTRRHKGDRMPAFHAFQVEVRREQYLLPPQVMKRVEGFTAACEDSLARTGYEDTPLRLDETYLALEEAANDFLENGKP